MALKNLSVDELNLSRESGSKKKVTKLSGIWMGKGIEKIKNLKLEIRNIRKKTERVLDKKFPPFGV